jgi:hypothetical protein
MCSTPKAKPSSGLSRLWNCTRSMLEYATGYRVDILEGRFVIEARHGRLPWEVIVEPDEARKLLVVMTAYPVERAES